ncbi:MAG: molybdopterin-dependent oxidoreductase [Rhizobiales bacterium]|nr:molybdopterin-dependent oxidoreductase [Hyphomicrobiales bacterium]
MSEGIGARLRRKEDDRYMRGRGQFVGDITLAGMLHVAFLRSPVAHARINAVRVPAAMRDRVFIAQDLVGVTGIRADTALPGFKSSIQPILADGKLRYVGELVAMCVAESRAAAEDLAGEIVIDDEELPAVTDMLAGRRADSALLHEEWGDNLFLTTNANVDFEAAIGKAAYKVTRELRTARQAMSPLEGRGVVAHWSERLGQLEVFSSTQQSHLVRSGLAECLDLTEAQIRVIAPDVGGGFGYKGILLPEEVALAWGTRRLGRPLKWLEDRRECLINGADCREHHYVLTAYADSDGRLLALDAEATVDAGAYSAYPFSACLEAGQVGSILPGLYDFPHYRCRTYTVATNKPPILPYRGVARTGVCFALEVTLEALAREAGVSPVDLRLKSLVRPEQMPFDNIAKRHFDSGDYPEALRRAVAAIRPERVAELSAKLGKEKKIGVGYAMYSEQAGHGTSVYASWGIPFVPGYEQCMARLTPDGGLELRIGAHSHGQGLETTLSQVAHSVLGLAHEDIKLVHGDTALTPYSTGTWGSRCMIMSGGAVAEACSQLRERALGIGAKLLQAAPSSVRYENGHIVGNGGKISIGEIARTWYRRPQNLPGDVDPAGLEVTAGYKAKRDTGTFSYAAHAVVVSVDTETGEVAIVDYVIVEDGGVLVNPMIVDGQIWGGAAQGIGTALYEEMAYDSRGQPLASTLGDYLLPGPTEVPEVRILHMETPSPYTTFGQKGLGEGGAIAPPAAIVNAINDALVGEGVEITVTPATPRRIVEALAAARRGKGATP